MIYFIRNTATGHIKIGYSVDPVGRLKQLQTGHHDRLEIIAQVEGDQGIERRYHAMFADVRKNGEWFDGLTVQLWLQTLAGHSDPEETTSVYLAGKIAKNDWRHEIFFGLSQYCTESGSRWQPGEGPKVHGFRCVGPFFIECDHGCFHGDGEHGVGAAGANCGDAGLSQNGTVSDCTERIDVADAVFAWLDGEAPFGSVWELGYANAHGKPVFLAIHERQRDIWRDAWFARTAAELCISTTSHLDAWLQFVRWWRGRHTPAPPRLALPAPVALNGSHR